MTIIDADDMAAFRREVLDSDVPVVVDFWAEWCGPCHAVAPVLEEIASDYRTAIKVVKVNVDRNDSVAHECGVQSIPMIALFEQGDMTKSAVGARPRDSIVEALGLERFRGTETFPAPMTEAPAPKMELGSDGRY